MTITASIIADSVSPDGHRITTMQLRYPRFIHAEFMTHRVFSRNASSSRAIPIEKMIRDVMEDPAMPVAWGSNKPGMQAGEELSGHDLQDCKTEWIRARDAAVASAKEIARLGAHKQIVNRLLEPFGHISVICTATEWDNFFALRCHPDADPTMRALAEAMRDARDASVPMTMGKIATGIWHLPYVKDEDYDYAWKVMSAENTSPFHTLARISAARCARVSYLNHDGTKPDITKDVILAERLLTSKHMSPFEHQADYSRDEVPKSNMFWGNFTGWDQYRKMVE